MSGTKTILQLNSLDKTSITGSDLLLIADIRNRETKNIETSEFVNYVNNKLNVLLSGSFTGSFKGNLVGVSDTASYSLQSDYSKTSSNLLFSDDLNGTSSYSISSSNTLFSVSSSVSNHASFALSSSISDITLYAAKTSSTTALESDSSDYSFRTYLSETSSYLNYVGQDNGTVVSSSFSERSLYVPLALDIFDKDSAVVAISKNSDFSFTSADSLSVVSASTADNVQYAKSSLERLFSSVEFYITVNDDGSIIVTPTSWKNVENISVDPAVIDKTSCGGAGKEGVQSGTAKKRPFTITFLIKYKKHPTVLDPTVSLSNVNTVVVSSLQLPQTNLIPVNWNSFGWEDCPFWYSSAYPCGLDGFAIKVIAYNWYLSSNVEYNFWWFEQFKTILNGARIGASVFCNTRDIVGFGPESTIDQHKTRVPMTNIATSEVMYLKQNKPINFSEILSDPQESLLGANNFIKSIASNEDKSFNLVLFTNKHVMFLKGGSIIGSYQPVEKTTSNFVYYENISKNYIIGHEKGIAYTSSIEDPDKLKSLPDWTQNNINKNVKSICGLDGTKYIFISGVSFTIPSQKPTENPTSLTDINILSSISSNSVTNPTIKTDKPRITTTLNSITRVNDSGSIAVGSNGVILYISASNKAYRIDDERRTIPGTSLYNYVSILTLTDVKVYNGATEKYVYVCGTDTTNTQCILSSIIPSIPSEPSNWKWKPAKLEIVGNTIPTTVKSSLNSIYFHSDEAISVGESTSEVNNVVYTLNINGGDLSFKGDINTKYTSIGWYSDLSGEKYLLGGSRNNIPILDVYSQTTG